MVPSATPYDLLFPLIMVHSPPTKTPIAVISGTGEVRTSNLALIYKAHLAVIFAIAQISCCLMALHICANGSDDLKLGRKLWAWHEMMAAYTLEFVMSVVRAICLGNWRSSVVRTDLRMFYGASGSLLDVSVD